MHRGFECLLVAVLLHSALLLTALVQLEAGIIWLVRSSILRFLSSYLLRRVIETVHTIGMWSQLYFWTITCYGRPEGLDKIIWSLVLAFMLSPTEGSIVQVRPLI